METRTVEQVESWPTQSFTGGEAGLRDLARAGFTGVVDAGPWVFLLNGTVVGVDGGDLDDVGGGTAYRSPDPSLVLLFAMQVTGGEERARYYTGKTSIAEVDRTLQDGGFTGYVELSENVLSGDYYLVYYGGESMACAFIGNARRLKTGDEAFELADDEVGIYSVNAVELAVTEVPGMAEEGATAAGGAAAGAAASTETGADDGTVEERSDEGSGPTEPAPEPAASEPAGGAAGDGATPADHDQSVASADAATESRERADTPGDEGGAEDPLRAAEATDTAAGPTPEEPASAGDGIAAVSDASPSRGPPPEPDAGTSADDDAGTEGPGADSTTEAAMGRDGDDEDPAQLRAQIATLERERDTLSDERDDLADERDRLASRVEELRARIDDLEAELARAGGTGGSETGPRLSAEEALEGTTLFVRYDSKSGATLDEAHEGGLNRESLGENLYLEYHTTFQSRGATVEGDPYPDFLTGTLEHRFVTWVVKELVYEIRDTDSAGSMRALYDTLPEIDRAELGGSVALGEREGGAEEQFDVVCRDRLGQPLLVAELRASRDPTEPDELEGLLEGARATGGAHETLSGAFLVTTSFFEPGTLDAAGEVADGGGLLSSSKKASYVKLDRKHGFHLCLVEGRDGRFHVVVPEL